MGYAVRTETMEAGMDREQVEQLVADAGWTPICTMNLADHICVWSKEAHENTDPKRGFSYNPLTGAMRHFE